MKLVVIGNSGSGKSTFARRAAAEHDLVYLEQLVFMNPGVAACVANNRRRPWEPHKYDSAADQERMLPTLLAWVEGYYTRDDPRSYAYHRRLFDAFTGPKRELA